MWRVGQGREPWEQSEAGGVNDNEQHLRHSPVSSPMEELRKDKKYFFFYLFWEVI